MLRRYDNDAVLSITATGDAHNHEPPAVKVGDYTDIPEGAKRFLNSKFKEGM